MSQFTKTQQVKVNEFLNSLKVDKIDIPYFIDIEEIDTNNAFDSIYEMIQDNNGFNVEIIYYGSAMSFLMENDPSLKQSLELANDFGFTPDNLNSEILASILASQYASEEFGELQDEINDFFINL